MENKAIELVQNPIIKHRILEIGKSVKERIANLEIEKLIVTEETIKSMKDLRASLNKENKSFEDDFKEVKKEYLKPLSEIEELKKTEITNIYANADNTLRDSILKFENIKKEEKKKNILEFFNEICSIEKIDFVSFERIVPEILLSVTEKKYKEQINEFIAKVIDDLNLIKSEEYEAEILTFYKSTLNVSLAITTIKERKEKERIEAEKIKAAETIRRQNVCKFLGMTWMDMFNCYELNSEIQITKEEILTLSKEEFNNKIANFEVQIKDLKSKEIEKKQSVISDTEKNTESAKKLEPASPISAPVEVVEEKTFVAKFQVIATREVLIGLQNYLKSNNINYTNL